MVLNRFSVRLLLTTHVQTLYPRIGPREAAWLIQRESDELKPEESIYLTRLCELSPEICEARNLCQSFIRMVRKSDVDKLDRWLEDVAKSNVSELKSFAKSLKQDYNAVRAALEYIWSQGQTEGQVNRLKLLKRQMYGRAKFDLLKARVLNPV